MKNYQILKTLCSKIYLVGSGDFWHEDNVIGDDTSSIYRVYTFLLFSIYGFMTILEIMATVMGDFPEDEKRDSTTFAVSHTIVMIKTVSVIINKDVIKDLNKKIISVCSNYEDEKLMAEKYRIMKINVVAYFVVVYGSAICFVLEGLRKVYEGSHFITVVTYYPAYEDNSTLAIIFRVSTTVVLCMMMMTMIVSVDSPAMIQLIMYKYKFITLRHYFENLSKEFKTLNELGNKKVAAEKLTKGLIEGIIMYSDVLKISKDIDKAFGTVLALQLSLSSGTAVSLLLTLALSDQLTFVATMKIILFVAGLFFLLGLFLCNAGEITYQASLLSDAIFYCGWCSCNPRHAENNIRKIVLLAILQAQRPLVMKAFKMVELTYATFLTVLRGTYSVFALFYANNK